MRGAWRLSLGEKEERGADRRSAVFPHAALIDPSCVV